MERAKKKEEAQFANITRSSKASGVVWRIDMYIRDHTGRGVGTAPLGSAIQALFFPALRPRIENDGCFVTISKLQAGEMHLN